jgi:hypothetical protein
MSVPRAGLLGLKVVVVLEEGPDAQCAEELARPASLNGCLVKEHDPVAMDLWSVSVPHTPTLAWACGVVERYHKT